MVYLGLCGPFVMSDPGIPEEDIGSVAYEKHPQNGWKIHFEQGRGKQL